MLAGIQPALAIAVLGEAQQHVGDRRDRQRQQHADEAEQLAAGHDREDHRHRVQADLVADDARGQHVAFQHLADREHHPDQHQQLQVDALRLDQRGGQRQDHAGGRAQVGNEADEPGDHADQQAQLQPHQRQSGRVDHAQRDHDHELPAQERAEHVVGLARQPRDRADVVARDQRGDALDQQVPVAQEVEGEDRQQDDVGQPGDHRHARARHVAEQCGREAAGLLPVGADPLGQAPGVEPADQFHAGLVLQPRQRGLQQPVAVARRGLDQGHDLPFKQRDQDHQPQHHHQRHRPEHHRHGDVAREAAPLQAVDQRIAQPAEQRTEHERGQDRAQQPDQPQHGGGHRQPFELAQETGDLLLRGRHAHRTRYSAGTPSTATTGASAPSMRWKPAMPVSRSRSNSTRSLSARAGAIRRTTGIRCSIAEILR